MNYLVFSESLISSGSAHSAAASPAQASPWFLPEASATQEPKLGLWQKMRECPLNWYKVLGLFTVLGISFAGWAVVALAVSHLLH